MNNLTEFFLNEFNEVKKRYYKLLFGGLIFILFGYIYILEPYFSYQEQKYILIKNLKAQEKQVKDIENLLSIINRSIYTSVISSEEISSRLEVFPYELAAVIREYEEYFENKDIKNNFKNLTYDDYDYYKTFSSIEDAVKWYVERWYKELFNLMEREIIVPLTENKLDVGLDKKGLIFIYKETFNNFETYFNSLDRNFWKKYKNITEDKSLLAIKVSSVFKEKSDNFLSKVNEEIDNFKSIAEKEKTKEDQLKYKMEELNVLEENLRNKLNNINSPIGNLPVSLSDFIKTFPFLISVISIIIFLNFLKLNKIKGLLTKTNDLNDLGLESKVKYSTDILFIKNFVLIVLFTTVFIVYLRSVYLIMINVDLFKKILGGINILEISIYSVFYFLGFLIFMFIFSYFFRNIKGVNKAPP